MIEIDHAGHTVETEAVKMKLLQPELHVGEEKAKHLPFAVIKDLGVPVRVVTALPGVKILMARAIEPVQPLQGIFGSMGVNQVHDHRNILFMRLFNEVFQIFRSAKPARNRKKVGDMISKGAIVRVFGHRHQLNYIIPGIFYIGDHVIGELHKGANAFPLLCHPCMSLIDHQLFQPAD